jgi:hypothetical protein
VKRCLPLVFPKGGLGAFGFPLRTKNRQQTKNDWARRWIEKEVRFAQDSLQEESGFEPLVPLATEMLIELARGITNPTRMLAVGDIGPVPRLC